MYQVYKAQWLITRELGDVRLCHCAGIPAPRSSQIDPRRKDEFVAFVLFGVIQDGEGMGIVGGKGTRRSRATLREQFYLACRRRYGDK